MCQNMACVSDPSECYVNYAMVAPIQFLANLNPLTTNIVTLAYWQNQAILKLILPSNSIPTDYSGLSTYASTNVEYTQSLRINPVPTTMMT